MSDQLISVITPTYGSAAFVRETIESVLSQTYGNVEHVLVFAVLASPCLQHI